MNKSSHNKLVSFIWSIADDSDSIVGPQNPNPRGAHGTDEDLDPLDLIINSFNQNDIIAFLSI